MLVTLGAVLLLGGVIGVDETKPLPIAIGLVLILGSIILHATTPPE